MEPLALATVAVGLLTPYLAKAAGKVAEKAGEAAWGKMQAVYTAVKNKLASDDYATQTLKRLEDEPASKSRQAALEGILEEQLKGDQAFADSLRQLLEEARAVGAETIKQQVTVSDHARTGDINQVGKIEGDVDMSKKR